MTLKGDVDNLGLIFQKGLEQPTFAKMAALSRQMNAFFAVWLPSVCQSEFPNTYTVFSGGDDFFLIGPWYSTIQLTQRMRDKFREYVAENPNIHFSAGLSMTKSGLPIRELGRLAEEALEKAKFHRSKPLKGKEISKNAVACFGQPVTWNDFEDLLQREAELNRLTTEHKLSKGYLYNLLTYTDMAGKVNDAKLDMDTRAKNAIWHSRFAYNTRRFVENKIKRGESREEIERERHALQEALASEIAGNGIAKHGAAYKIALFTYLYQRRD